GNFATSADPLARVTTTTFDKLGHLTQVQDALGDLSTATYDAAGLVLTATDTLNRQTSTVYDSSNRGLVAKSFQAQGRPAQSSHLTTFDSAGHTSQDRNADGYSTVVTDDPVGLPVQPTDSLNRPTPPLYDLAGQVVASRDELGRWPKYQYNLRGWLTQTTDADRKST